MSDFNPTPFKGEAGVPHVPEDWFTTLFVSTQVAVLLNMFPGRIAGLHVRPNRINRDYAIACANEASMALAARSKSGKEGKKLPTMGYRKPRATDDSFHKMWFSHLQWKAWRLDRQGGGYTPRF